MVSTAIESPYRWVILALVWFANTSGALIQLSGAPVQLAVASEFHLNAAEVTTWLNLPLLSIAILAIPAGLAVDRVGGRTLMAVALLIMGVFGLTRGLAPGFLALSIATFLFGLGEAILLSGMPKVVGEWFPPREVGRAVGIYTSGAAVGVLTVFLGAPPLFGQDWRRLFLASGAVALVALAMWLVFGRTGAGGASPAPARQGHLAADLRHLLRLQDVRLLALMCACLQVGLFSWLALGFPFLVLAKAASAETAGAVVSLTMLGFWGGATITPVLSDRAGRRRPFFTAFALLATLGLALLPFLAVGFGMWTVVLLLGFSFGTIQVLLVRGAPRARRRRPAPGGRVRRHHHLVRLPGRHRRVAGARCHPRHVREGDGVAVPPRLVPARRRDAGAGGREHAAQGIRLEEQGGVAQQLPNVS